MDHLGKVEVKGDGESSPHPPKTLQKTRLCQTLPVLSMLRMPKQSPEVMSEGHPGQRWGHSDLVGADSAHPILTPPHHQLYCVLFPHPNPRAARRAPMKLSPIPGALQQEGH